MSYKLKIFISGAEMRRREEAQENHMSETEVAP